MANTITAGNATNNGMAFLSDSTGELNILTGTGSGTTALSINASQNVTVAGTASITGNTTITGNLTLTGNPSGIIKIDTAKPSTSGSTIDFTGIPSTVKRITIMFNAVSVSSTGNLLVRGGVGGVIDDAGYASTSTGTSGGGGGTTSSTAGYIIRGTSGTMSLSGHMVLTLLGSNTWISSHVFTFDASSSSTLGGGTNTFSGTLDTIRITTTGADTFDAGSINILYE
jgi:hypothetical protein